jgi:hypothetical protein
MNPPAEGRKDSEKKKKRWITAQQLRHKGKKARRKKNNMGHGATEYL